MEKGRTKDMRILIIGDGKVGYTLAQQLSQEDHDIKVDWVITDRRAVKCQIPAAKRTGSLS